MSSSLSQSVAHGQCVPFSLICPFLSLSLFLSIHLSIGLHLLTYVSISINQPISLDLSNHLLIDLSIFGSISPYRYPSSCLYWWSGLFYPPISAYRSIHLPISLSIPHNNSLNLTIHPSIYLYPSLSWSMYVNLSVLSFLSVSLPFSFFLYFSMSLIHWSALNGSADGSWWLLFINVPLHSNHFTPYPSLPLRIHTFMFFTA